MTDVVMPQMGESIVEGTLTRWLKKPGDHVERDEPLFEISTDKVDTEIPSPAAGTLSEVMVEEGKTVGISTVVARIDEAVGQDSSPAAGVHAGPPTPLPAEQAPAAPAEEAAPPAQAEEEPAQPAEPAGPLSPLVRRMAREYSIDLSKVKGTGAGGRITKQDLEGYIGRQPQAPTLPPPPPPPPPVVEAAPAPRVAPTAEPSAPAPQMPPLPAAGQAKTRIEPHEHDAHPHRRAHARQPPHLRARHHHT